MSVVEQDFDYGPAGDVRIEDDARRRVNFADIPEMEPGYTTDNGGQVIDLRDGYDTDGSKASTGELERALDVEAETADSRVVAEASEYFAGKAERFSVLAGALFEADTGSHESDVLLRMNEANRFNNACNGLNEAAENAAAVARMAAETGVKPSKEILIFTHGAEAAENDEGSITMEDIADRAEKALETLADPNRAKRVANMPASSTRESLHESATSMAMQALQLSAFTAQLLREAAQEPAFADAAGAER